MHELQKDDEDISFEDALKRKLAKMTAEEVEEFMQAR